MREASVPLFYKVSGKYLDQIVRLIPELAEADEPKEFISNSWSDSEEHRQPQSAFFTAMSQFFARLSLDSTLVLMFDDVQWADQATADLLRFVVNGVLRDHPIIILCLCRDFESKNESSSISTLLHETSQIGLLQEIHLGPFDFEGVMRLLVATSGQKGVSDEFGDLIFNKSGGNPFFMEEILRSLVEKGDVFLNERGMWDRKPISQLEIPSSIRAIIKQRLDLLNESTRSLLRAAAVMGEVFESGILLEVIEEQDRSCFDRSLDSAISSRLIRSKNPTRDGSEVFTFVDELVHDLLLEELPVTILKKLHQKIANAVEDRSEVSRSLDEHSSSLAVHYFDAGDWKKALEYSEIAGNRAVRLYAHEEASKHYARALELLTKGEGDYSAKARVLTILGDENWLLGRFETSLGQWSDAAEAFETIHETKSAGEMYRRLAFTYHTPFFDKTNSYKCINHAIEILEPLGKSEELAFALLNASIIFAWDNQIRKARDLFENGQALGKEMESRMVQSIAAYTSIWILDFSEREKVLLDCEKAIEFLIEKGHVRQTAFAYATRASLHALTKGPSKETLIAYSEAIQYAERVGQSAAAFALKADIATSVYFALGDWEKVNLAAETLGIIAKKAPVLLSLKCYSLLAAGLFSFGQGDLDSSEKQLKELASIAKGFGQSALVLRPFIMLGRICLLKRKFEEAEKFLLQGYEISRARGLSLSNAMNHVELLSVILEYDITAKKSLEEAESHLAELRSAAIQINESWALAYYHRGDGLLARNQMESEEALRSLENSLKIWREIGWKYELAKTAYELALTYYKIGDSISSKKCIQEALMILKVLGAKVDIDKCSELERILKIGVYRKSSNQKRRLYSIILSIRSLVIAPQNA